MKKKLLILLVLLGIATSVLAQSEPDVTVIPDNTRYGARFIPERRPDNRTPSQSGAGAIWFNTNQSKWFGDTGTSLFDFGSGSGGSPTFGNQSANTVFAGPSTGGPATPAFRLLLASDIPSLDAAKVTSGTFLSARIPALNTISSGLSDGCVNSTSGILGIVSCGTGGTVTSFSAGNLAPLFTTNVTNPTTTPALSFSLSSQTQNLFFASPDGSSGNPSFRAILPADIPGLDAAKIISGTFGAARIPALSALSGAVTDTQVPDLDTLGAGLSDGCVKIISNFFVNVPGLGECITPLLTVASTNPTSDDDSGDGYSRGSFWINDQGDADPANDTLFIAVAVDVSAAKWILIQTSSTPSIDATFNASADGKINNTTTTKPVGIRGDSGFPNHGFDIYVDSSGVGQFKCVVSNVRDACDYLRQLAAGKIGGFTDSSSVTQFAYQEGVGVIKFTPGTEVHGDIAYRGANAWERLAADSGKFLKSQGSGSAPLWEALPVASDTQAGISELAIASEVNTGTDATRSITPDALAGSNFGRIDVELVVFDFTTAITTGDGKYYFVITPKINGMNLIAVSAYVNTVSSSGAINIDLARCAVVATGNACSGTVVDMLSTNLTIDANEEKSSTAAAAAVIDTANDDVVTDQRIRVDVDGAGTGAQGLVVVLSFQLP